MADKGVNELPGSTKCVRIEVRTLRKVQQRIFSIKVAFVIAIISGRNNDGGTMVCWLSSLPSDRINVLTLNSKVSSPLKMKYVCKGTCSDGVSFKAPMIAQVQQMAASS